MNETVKLNPAVAAMDQLGQSVKDLKSTIRLPDPELVEEALIAAAETGADREIGFDPDRWIENWMERNGNS